MSCPIRVFLLDDHEIVRRGVRDLIDGEPDMVVVGEAGTADEALACVAATQPDVALLDVRLTSSSGIEVCRDIRSHHPDVACLMLTSFADDEALLDSVVAGASGYVLKRVRGSEVVGSVRTIAAGGSLMSSEMIDVVRHRLRTGPGEDRRLASLTVQERKVVDLLADGLSNREIGLRLSLSEKTVKNYMSNVLAKLGMKRRTEAAVFSMETAARRRSTP